ncbi:protein kinase domain-containing protein [Pectinatus frisingensis]|uniref:protein kinase domain-containing protein n=1 Tax=Pectinatus frisingensis TaxID=865 RepID=UPI0015F612C7|nr:protein kinase [Pectinatus frisingensis]
MEQEQLGTDTADSTAEPSENKIIESTYRTVKLLKRTDTSETILVAAKKTGALFVLKHIYSTGLAYDKLRNITSSVLPIIYYVSENKAFGVTTVVEEYITGITLVEWMEQRDLEPVNATLAKLIFEQLADGLQKLHAAHIVHRAICPENIMIMSGKVKYIGFDHCTASDDVDKVTLYKGMTGFAAPEQTTSGKADFRSDVYSLGMTMQNLLGTDYKGKYARILRRCKKTSDKRYKDGAQLKKAVKNAWLVSLVEIGGICAAVYIIIFGALFAFNKWYDPMKEIKAQQAFAQEQESARQETEQAELEKGMGNSDGQDGTDVGVNGLAKGKLSLSLAFPGKPQEENAGSIVVNMGKAAGLSEAGDAKGKDSVFFPDKAKLVLTIKNNTDSDIKNPVIKFVPYYIDLSQISDPPNTITKHLAGAVECRRDISIPAGNEMKFELPLSRAVLLYPAQQNAKIKVIVRSDNYADTAAEIKFAFN